ncbi:MAG: hypothetical protein ACXWQE_00150 [Bdellovibrionales bacterium]
MGFLGLPPREKEINAQKLLERIKANAEQNLRPSYEYPRELSIELLNALIECTELLFAGGKTHDEYCSIYDGRNCSCRFGALRKRLWFAVRPSIEEVRIRETWSNERLKKYIADLETSRPKHVLEYDSFDHNDENEPLVLHLCARGNTLEELLESAIYVIEDYKGNEKGSRPAIDGKARTFIKKWFSAEEEILKADQKN